VKTLLIAGAVLLVFSLGANWFLERTIKKLEETVQGQQFLIDGFAEREARLRSEIAKILKKRRKDGMVDFRILNGWQRCTLIERFDGTTIVLSAGKKLQFEKLDKAKQFIRGKKLEVNISHIFGLPANRKVDDHGN
jgi:hypothetical protein